MPFHGRLILTGQIYCRTALHIGGASTGIDIGGVDNIVVRNPWNNQPYIPGSSLRGKMRSLLERAYNLDLTQNIGPYVRIHRCGRAESYRDCPVCVVFGVTSDEDFATPARLQVRDVALEQKTAEILEKLKTTELPYTEVKWEVAIDRITSAANPRQQERVPAGVTFGPFEMIFSFYDESVDQDLRRFRHLVEAMALLQDDYLGGGGSRGNGKIEFMNMRLEARSREDYREGRPRQEILPEVKELNALVQEETLQKVRQKLASNGK